MLTAHEAELAALRDQISHMDAYNQGFLAYTRGESGEQMPYPDSHRNVHWTNGYAAGIEHIGKLQAALVVAKEMATEIFLEQSPGSILGQIAARFYAAREKVKV